MSFTELQISQLEAPLDRACVSTRSQSGRELSYIEAWHAISEANRIFGFDGWNRETVELRQLGEPRITKDRNGNEQNRVGYSARVRITVYAGDRVIIREGCGFGSGIDRDVDQAHESALKEAESDAMKRALMTFGNQFGLALYDKQQAAVVSTVVSTATMAINMCRTTEELTKWSADNKAMLDSLTPYDKADVRAAWSKRNDELKSNDPFGGGK